MYKNLMHSTVIHSRALDSRPCVLVVARLPIPKHLSCMCAVCVRAAAAATEERPLHSNKRIVSRQTVFVGT